MNIFISWSGERSRKVAELLDNWLQCVLQAVKPWMSTKDIDKGSLWFSEISSQLKNTSVGIICLTHSNKEKPWILFEAGALAKGLTSNRVCTFLVDLDAIDIEDPLAQFNHTFPQKESMWNLVSTLNDLLVEQALKESILDTVFETYWPQFEESFKQILAQTTEETPITKRANDDLLSELVTLTRSLDKRFRCLEEDQRKIYEDLPRLRLKDQNSRISLIDVDRYIKDLVGQDLSEQEILGQVANLLPEDIIRSRIDKHRKNPM